MSGADKKYKEPLDKAQARKLVLQLVDYVVFSTHALVRRSERSLSTGDIMNIIKAQISKITNIEQDEKTDQWKYNLETNNMGICFKFVAKFTKIYVITAYRKGRK